MFASPLAWKSWPFSPTTQDYLCHKRASLRRRIKFNSVVLRTWSRFSSPPFSWWACICPRSMLKCFTLSQMIAATTLGYLPPSLAVGRAVTASGSALRRFSGLVTSVDCTQVSILNLYELRCGYLPIASRGAFVCDSCVCDSCVCVSCVCDSCVYDSCVAFYIVLLVLPSRMRQSVLHLRCCTIYFRPVGEAERGD